jgi:hypothetical protein
VIDNGHASILATMAAVVASLMTVEINGRISGACILLVNNYVQAKVTHGNKERIDICYAITPTKKREKLVLI